MKRLLPKSWMRETPPVFVFPRRVRLLGAFLGFYTVCVAMLLCSYSSDWTTPLLLGPIGACGLLLGIVSWQEA